MKLYEIERKYLEALDVFTDPDADIPPETVADTLEAIEGEFERKAVNVAAFARQMEAEAEAIKQAEEKMAKRRKALENRARWLRDYLKTGMEVMGMKKIPSPWFVLSVQKNPPAVDIFDEAAVPDEFKETEILVRIDKAAIKEAINAGREVPGARMVNGTRLSIR
ncbi:siphovirus Gp157 family protein [Methylocaldum szegediense]|uniref:Virus Gp157 n=1 Tax=Methylocaldum szegediense TaxID=73780 RepID=A0ABN8XDS8_9GAMM|nr:siphovirus Gp157 family protein [Methylocaldum szegediense]CAI8981679.1 Virus Gp157 [Methylocaldum szegediense]